MKSNKVKKFILSLVVLIWLVASTHGTEFKTKNFIVEAPNSEMAKVIGEHAEWLRKYLAIKWLGKELKETKQVVIVYHYANKLGGATTFHDQIALEVEMYGDYIKVLENTLHHEITHVVTIGKFKKQVKWAEEGCAVMEETETHKKLFSDAFQQFHKDHQTWKLSTLFGIRDNYPTSEFSFYAQSYHVVNFLVNKKDRITFLNFIEYACDNNFDWDKALKKYYKVDSINELEAEWLRSIK